MLVVKTEVRNVGYNTPGSQVLYRFNTPTFPATPVPTTITSTDPVWGKLLPGDMMSDGNGRLYYLGYNLAPNAGPGGPPNGGAPFDNYLFYVDSSNIAHRLGSYQSTNGAVGVAFDQTGKVYTLDGTKVNRIDLSNSTISYVGDTGIAGIDLGSCAQPVMNPNFNANDAVAKQVRNVTINQPLTTQNSASPGDILEYQITIKNSGNLPSDSTKFADSIPAGTTYVAGSTKMYDSAGTIATATPVADVAGAAPFTQIATGSTPDTAAGMLVNTYGEFAGVVKAGVSNALIVKFQVKVDANGTGIIPNAATLTYPVANAGLFTKASQTSNLVNTTLSVKISGTVWNDLDLSGSTSTIFTTGESGTNTGSSSLYAYLLDPTGQIVLASSPVAADGSYSFPTVLPNQTGLSIELSTTPPASSLAAMPVPTPSLPTGWSNTAPLKISANTALTDVAKEDFGIVKAATVASVKISGTVWNDRDLSGKTSTIFTTGESGTDTGSSSLYAYLLDPTGQIVLASSPVAADGTYTFPTVLPNQTGLSIELSTTPPTSSLATMPVPTPSLPTGWKKTAPLTISANTAVIDVTNEDFGIVHGATVVLVKRVTGIMPAGTSTWVRTANPNDNTPLNTVVHDTPNDASTINWPTPSYLVGATNAGLVKAGDKIEYTIYYLNAQGADALNVKICDPIRGDQSYLPESIQLFPAGATTASVLTDAIDATDRAYAYGSATTTNNPVPTDCNINATTTGVDRGGVAVQITGTGASNQPDLPALPGATAAGIPANSYGALRFTTVVAP